MGFKKFRALLTGYFWLPCPGCGQMFAGYECGPYSMWEDRTRTRGWAMCRDHTSDLFRVSLGQEEVPLVEPNQHDSSE